VVDTSVVSYLLKGHSLGQVYWDRHLSGKLLGVSFMTVAELYRWPLERAWSEWRVAALIEHLRGYAVMPYDDSMSWEWAKLMSRKGRPISPGDAWIAATALAYGASLVTHNARHFAEIDGLEVLSVSE
jgi:tRNA(fMet)-specific endonuclease VapC